MAKPFSRMLRSVPFTAGLLLIIALLLSCKHQPAGVLASAGDYPPDVRDIMVNKCATVGCHDNSGYKNADALNLSTWETLFRGSGTGSTVIPYRPDFSSLCYFINSDSTRGISLLPAMPFNLPRLSDEEYFTIRNWIAAGAPDAKGNIRFSDNPTRSKIYVTNRLCNVVTVFDAASLLQMRYVDVGNNTDARYPYCIKVSPDKKSWYVSFFTHTNIVQKFDAQNDMYLGDIDLGPGSWTSFAITADSKHGYFIDDSYDGKICYVDLVTLQVLSTYTFGGKFRYLAGAMVNDPFGKLYVGTTNGNFIYSINITNPFNPVIEERVIDCTAIPQYQSLLDPVELAADQNAGHLYIACVKTAEIRVVDMKSDSLIATIPLGSPPAFMSFSHITNKLFVSCPDDSVSFPGNRGSVLVIDAVTNTLLKKIKTGYQPYGLCVDDDRGLVTVVNANISSGGPASHHASGCGKKNGNVTFIDLNTLELVFGKKPEVAVYPFGVAIR